MKISVVCVISAFERSLMYTRKSCSGRETARCRCKIRYVSKFTAASRGPQYVTFAVFKQLESLKQKSGINIVHDEIIELDAVIAKKPPDRVHVQRVAPVPALYFSALETLLMRSINL